MRLIDNYIPVFQGLKELHQELSDTLDKSLIGVKEDLNALLSKVNCASYSKQQNQNALFAVCALIDEMILASDWKHRDEWANEPFQKTYFDTQKAGMQFYERLDGLNENDDKEQDVREVFLYALVQGFSGCYFESGEQSVKQEIIQANYALLSKNIDSHLFSPEIPNREINNGSQVSRKKQKELLLVLVPIAAVLLTYFLLRSDLVESVSQILSQI
jgi:type VI secretion system protein ImpK